MLIRRRKLINVGRGSRSYDRSSELARRVRRGSASRREVGCWLLAVGRGLESTGSAPCWSPPPIGRPNGPLTSCFQRLPIAFAVQHREPAIKFLRCWSRWKEAMLGPMSDERLRDVCMVG